MSRMRPAGDGGGHRETDVDAGSAGSVSTTVKAGRRKPGEGRELHFNRPPDHKVRGETEEIVCHVRFHLAPEARRRKFSGMDIFYRLPSTVSPH